MRAFCFALVIGVGAISLCVGVPYLGTYVAGIAVGMSIMYIRESAIDTLEEL